MKQQTIKNNIQKEVNILLTKLEKIAINYHQQTAYTVQKLKNACTAHARDLDQKLISGSLYVKNCRNALNEAKDELSRPYTVTDKIYHGIMHTIRALFNILDQAYCWLISREQTFADDHNYKPFFKKPTTKLAQEIATLSKSLDDLATQTQKIECSVDNQSHLR